MTCNILSINISLIGCRIVKVQFRYSVQFHCCISNLCVVTTKRTGRILEEL